MHLARGARPDARPDRAPARRGHRLRGRRVQRDRHVSEFIDDAGVGLIGVEPAGEGLDTSRNGAPINNGTIGILHGARSYLMRSPRGTGRGVLLRISGLVYPGRRPGARRGWPTPGRARYVGVTDVRGRRGLAGCLSRWEGIIPALESAHALAQALRIARAAPSDAPAPHLLVCLSGRGDKDLDQVRARSGGSFSPDSAVARARVMVEEMGRRTEYLPLTRQES